MFTRRVSPGAAAAEAQHPATSEAPREPRPVDDEAEPPDEEMADHRSADEAGGPAAEPLAGSSTTDERTEAAPTRSDEEPRGGRSRTRFGFRRPTKRGEPEHQKHRHLVESVESIEDLLADMPLAGDVEVLAHHTLAELVLRLDPVTACVWSVEGERLLLAAGHGLTPAERKLRVAIDHPLITQLVEVGGGILIRPTDLAQGLVAGIAGARTESFMAAAVGGAGRVRAVLGGGAEELERSDLDWLQELAIQAEPFFAVGALVKRLRA